MHWKPAYLKHEQTISNNPEENAVTGNDNIAQSNAASYGTNGSTRNPTDITMCETTGPV